MPKFRKKPTLAEAHQWHKNGDHPLDYSKDRVGLENGEIRTFTAAERRANGWEGDIVRYFRHPAVAGGKVCGHCGACMDEHGWIDSGGDGRMVCPGDWIITGVGNDFYPCRPVAFAVMYEPVDG